MKKAIILMLSVLLLILSACNTVQAPVGETNTTAVVPTVNQWGLSIDEYYSGFIPDPDYPLAIWVGAYHFVELRNPNEYVGYELKLFRANEEYYAYVERSDYQDDGVCLWLASVNGTENQIDLVFERPLKGDDREFKQGQVLLTLSLRDRELYTSWQALQPRSEDTPSEGQTIWRGGGPSLYASDYDSVPKISEVSHDLSSWVGNYSYTDGNVVDHDGFLFAYYYNVVIYEHDDMYWAYLTVEGRGCASYIHAAVQGDAESIQLLFVRTLPLSMPSFEEHSIKIAFSLMKKDRKLYTKWDALTPMAHNYEEEGIYFVRES